MSVMRIWKKRKKVFLKMTGVNSEWRITPVLLKTVFPMLSLVSQLVGTLDWGITQGGAIASCF